MLMFTSTHEAEVESLLKDNRELQRLLIAEKDHAVFLDRMLRSLETEYRNFRTYCVGHHIERLPAKTPFTKDEIRTLIQLCHPDKHGGKESAVTITQKLLKLR